MKIALLTDTNSGIHEHEGQKMDVHVLPMPVIIAGKVYYEGTEFSGDQLCSILHGGGQVTTSQPTMGDMTDKWTHLLLGGYDEVVYIPMSSGLSGGCSAAAVVAEDFGGRVHVVDNHRVSVTQRASVLKARRLIDAGLTGREVAELLEKDAYNASIYVSVEDIRWLKKGGRVTPAAATVASVLGIKPVLTIQGGRLDSYMRVRGSMRRCEMKMLEAVRHDLNTRFNRLNMSAVHVGAAGFGLSEEEESRWLDLTRKAFPQADVYYDALPASIGVHTGPGAVGIGVSVDFE